ncbi:MAG: YerC/YecD family TrpR-related protein [Clostridiaceae bacterium]
MSDYNSKLKSEAMDHLCDAFLKLETREECYRFFEDICTISEIKAIEQRLMVAKMLKDKKTYTDIAKETGASTATISRVNKCLHYGNDGYNIVLDRLEDK